MESTQSSAELEALLQAAAGDATALFEQYEPLVPDLQASNDDRYGACDNLYLVPS